MMSGNAINNIKPKKAIFGIRIMSEDLTNQVSPKLSRNLGLMGLAATGICSMLGAAINVVPFMIQRNVPGIGEHVLSAYFFAAIPAIFAAIAYAILASAMPRAGGSYIYASRSMSPYLGFIASFAQWFGLSIAIGVVSYVLITFLRDIASSLGWDNTAVLLELGWIRVSLALSFLWTFVYINIRGVKLYEKTLVPMMFLMFLLGGIVIVAGFSFDQQDFAQAVLERDGSELQKATSTPFDFRIFLAAGAVLFSSFIGFDSIAQAGGEAKNPGKSLPLAIIISISTVGLFYFLFTGAIYHAVPWSYIAERSQIQDVTAPGLLSYLLSPGWAVAIIGGAAIALINDLPAMLLAVSRLMYAWAEDGIFPKVVSKIHPNFKTPHVAIILSGFMASVGILGSHFAGDFFLGIDILVTSMLVNFLLMCLSVLFLPHKNPGIAKEIKVFKKPALRIFIAFTGTVMLLIFLIIHISKDLKTELDEWYFHSTYIWILVMGVASIIFFREITKLRNSGTNIFSIFSKLPPE